MYRHIRASHENELFDCTECGKKFKTNYELLRHVQYVHSSEKKTFACSLCTKRYNDPGNLQYHISAIHEGTRIQCNECNKTFTQKSNRDRHVKNNHTDNDMKIKKCDTCDKSYYRVTQIEICYYKWLYFYIDT